MDTRYKDLRTITDKIKTMAYSNPARERYCKQRDMILKQLKHPEVNELRRKMNWAYDNNRESLRESCEERLREIQEYEL